MNKLPPELYRPIIQHLDKTADIVHLLFCSKAFKRECEPILYTEIILEGPRATPLHLFQLTRNPRASSLITSLTFIAQTTDSLDDVPSLRPAFSALYNLRSLKLRSYSSFRRPFMGLVLDGVSFKLHAFSCPYAWDADLVRFLSGQDELRTLEWHGLVFSRTITTPIVLPNMLPYLTNIHTDGNMIIYLTPGRPISRVHHQSPRPHVDNLPLLLSQSLTRIDVLVMGLLPRDQDTLESWKHHLSDLRFLECVINYTCESSLYTILTSLTKLTKLILLDVHRHGLSTDRSYQLVAKAFDLTPSLRIVEREFIVQHAFFQWTRGGGDPISLPRPRDADQWLYY